jgi:hypothetical protein
MYIADAQNPGVNVATAILQRVESIRSPMSALGAIWRTHFASYSGPRNSGQAIS